MTINDMPKKLELTCQVTGKKTIWLNRECMLKAALKHGSLDAFVKQYKSRGADKSTPNVEPNLITPVVTQKNTKGEPTTTTTDVGEVKYITRKFDCGDGTFCTVMAPAPQPPKFVETNENTHAVAKAIKAVSS